MRVRIQVDDEHGTAAVILDVDLSDEQRALLEPLLAPLSRTEGELLLCRLVRAKADEDAYERVCRERGLLL